MKNLNTLTKILIMVSIFIPGLTIAQTLERNTAERNTDATVESIEIDTANTDESENSDEKENIESREKTDEIEEINDENQDEKTENTRVISESISNLREESKILENEIRSDVKDTIDRSILDIRSQTDIEAYELQRIVDETRKEIYEDINQTLRNSKYTDTEPVRELQIRVKDGVTKIRSDLQQQTNVDLAEEEDEQEIDNKFNEFIQKVEENAQILREREGELIDQDTDGDGLSDYDEKFIYKTDPNNAKTVDGELTDAEKVERGINPISTSSEPMAYEDPRTNRTAFISKIHKVESVELVVDEETQERRLSMRGTGLPNSYVTVFIYSTPTIVTVKTNERGEWSYTLDKEIEDGSHEVYVATVDNTGNLVAKSETIPIAQTAEAAALGVFGIGEPNPTQNNFVQENFILIIISILLLAIIVTLIISGSRPSNDDEFADVSETDSDPDTNTEKTFSETDSENKND